METDITIFKENEVKDMTLTLRLTARQKDSIVKLAKQKKMPVSKYILSLVGMDYANLNKSFTIADNTKQPDKTYDFNAGFEFG